MVQTPGTVEKSVVRKSVTGSTEDISAFCALHIRLVLWNHFIAPVANPIHHSFTNLSQFFIALIMLHLPIILWREEIAIRPCEMCVVHEHERTHRTAHGKLTDIAQTIRTLVILIAEPQVASTNTRELIMNQLAIVQSPYIALESQSHVIPFPIVESSHAQPRLQWEAG